MAPGQSIATPAPRALRPGTITTLLVVWLLAMIFSWCTYTRADDHFARISPGRQTARYGELPFRDYFDPAYPATEYASAAVQLIFGDNLLGETLLNTSFIAGGAVIVLILARRLAGSWLVGVLSAFVAVASMPRAYDYDKCLFYPLGLLLCWRYIDRPTAGRLALLGAGSILAGVFRYDNGLFMLLGGSVALAVLHHDDRQLLAWRAGLLAVVTLLAAAPVLVFIQVQGGLANAVQQALDYGLHEQGRSRLKEWPRFILPEPEPPPDVVFVRWAKSVDDTARAALESRFHLTRPKMRGEASKSTWAYTMLDTSAANLRALVGASEAEDTHLIDRSRWIVVADRPPPPPLLVRLIPTPENAVAILYYLCVGLTLAVTVAAARRAVSVDMVERAEAARALSLAAMAAAVIVLILRDPLAARIGGAIAPFIVLMVWVCARSVHGRGVLVGGALAAALTLAAIAGLAGMGEWNVTLPRAMSAMPRLPQSVAEHATSPPPYSLLPTSRAAGLITYVRECTGPDDRVFMNWFEPEVPFFAQRAFAGGIPVMFGGHWSAPKYQRRMLDKLQSESVPLVFFYTSEIESFRHNYPMLDEYLQTRYRTAGATSFSFRPGDTYTVMVDKDRVPARTHPASGMPCFM